MTTNHDRRRQQVGTLKENAHIMRKTLTTFVTGAIVATTLVACGTEPDSDTNDDTGPSSTQTSESAPGDVEAVDIDLPVAYSHLVGRSTPEGVSVMCVGDHAFLYTWNARGYGGGSGITRFAEQDELCPNIQAIQE